MKTMKHLFRIALCLTLSVLLAMGVMLQAAAGANEDLAPLQNDSAQELLNDTPFTDNWVVKGPTGNEVGYSSARVAMVDTTKIPNITAYESFPFSDYYKITNAEGFLKLDAELYNYCTFSTVTIYLANDIDMSEVEGFMPISYDIEHVKHVNGSPRFYFAGILDGQGEAICNLKMNSTEEPLKFGENGRVDMENGKVVDENLVCVGLFGVTSGVTIKNLIIDKSCEFSYSGSAVNPCVSALVAKSVGSIEIDNVWNMANVTGGRFVGAVSARPAGKYRIKNVTNSGNVVGTQMVGGFIGFDGSGGLIENCRNAGNVKRTSEVPTYHSCSAGFVGRARTSVTLKDCINNGNIEGYSNVGAFLGTIRSDNTLNNCTNYGVLTATGLPETVGVAFAAQETTADGGSMGSCDINGVVDYAGQTDPTLMFEEVEIDFGVDIGCTVCNYQFQKYDSEKHFYGCTGCREGIFEPHEWVLKSNKNPTHTEEGVKTYSCQCGETRTDILPKTSAHNWDNGKITVEPTHITAGEKTFTCPCGETKTQTVPKLDGHDYSNWVTYDEELHQSTCECGDVIYEEHEWSSDSTSWLDYLKPITCLNCGVKKNQAAATTETGTTEATGEQTTAATTAQKDDDRDEDDEKEKDKEELRDFISNAGCGSTVISGTALISLISIAAIALLKKKED